jgi:zinc transport system ATP-binding protein
MKDMATPEPLVSARGLGVRLDGRRVLRDVDLAVAPGEIVTIVGPNGSGKSTLLRALLGAVPAAEGAVTRRRGLRLGYVPQRLAPGRTMPLTVRRFLTLQRRAGGVDAALARTGATGLADRQVADLSGGQLQRVLLAGALMDEPQLLMLDEATQGLDQPGSAAFYRLIEEIRAEIGCAVLMVSHELHVVMAASDRVICLNGHVCCEGRPEQVAGAPAYRALFGTGTGGALALYRHEHSHSHDETCDHGDVRDRRDPAA